MVRKDRVACLGCALAFVLRLSRGLDVPLVVVAAQDRGSGVGAVMAALLDAAPARHRTQSRAHQSRADR